MKIRIEIDKDIEETEVTITCAKLTPQVLQLQELYEQVNDTSNTLILYKGDVEYFIDLNTVLFFETENTQIYAHTRNDVFQTKYKLYELEKILPIQFTRISKSAIVNINQIYSIHRNLTSSSLIEFQNTHKTIYVSRAYYKILKQHMEEKRK